ncbi:MAG: hypothetical protein LBL17_05035 [Coxiellaceae bacterium]|jgi:predicted HTH transcriptional regulator|nr:hypothetical protein [Coxiellaceae bacterium]
MITEFKRLILSESFDEQPFPKASSEDIDFRVTAELFKEVGKLKTRDLKTLNIVVKYQGHLIPTIGDIILFGIHRNKYFPDSWIQMGKFEGKDKRYIVDTIELKSYPIITINDGYGFCSQAFYA